MCIRFLRVYDYTSKLHAGDLRQCLPIDFGDFVGLLALICVINVYHHLKALQNLVAVIHTILHETLLFCNAALHERHEAQSLSIERQRPNFQLLLKIDARLSVRERNVCGARCAAVVDV